MMMDLIILWINNMVSWIYPLDLTMIQIVNIIDNYMNTKTKTDPEMMFRITLPPVKQRGSKAKKNVAT